MLKTDFDTTDERAVDDEIEVMPQVRPLRPRRRPWLLVVGVVVTAASAALAATLYLAVDERTEALALARDVGYGRELRGDDLVTVRVALDAQVASVAAEDLSKVVGQRAATGLTKGQLLTPESIRADRPPNEDTQLVAVPLPPSAVPAQGLQSGDEVDLVSTPGKGAKPPEDAPPTVSGTVTRVGEPDESGTRVVDVEVDQSDGAALAARAATGNIAVVVNPAGGKD
ncbi:SAF domain-containing protein [Salinactinospora qingdaonensis]|uniref:SAF domain-containing protein n=1 Tax=Salinactinospora qingdaonensis TaxID=702744 RepID=UPI0031E95DDA